MPKYEQNAKYFGEHLGKVFQLCLVQIGATTEQTFILLKEVNILLKLNLIFV